MEMVIAFGYGMMCGFVMVVMVVGSVAAGMMVGEWLFGGEE